MTSSKRASAAHPMPPESTSRLDRRWLRTITGRLVDVTSEPSHLMVDPKDIAFSLARTWRYGAHSNPLVSWATHLLATAELLSRTAPPASVIDSVQVVLAGLLYDAHVAYQGESQDGGTRFQGAIDERFRPDWWSRPDREKLQKRVRQAKRVVHATEAKLLGIHPQSAEGTDAVTLQVLRRLTSPQYHRPMQLWATEIEQTYGTMLVALSEAARAPISDDYRSYWVNVAAYHMQCMHGADGHQEWAKGGYDSERAHQHAAARIWEQMGDAERQLVSDVAYHALPAHERRSEP